VGATFGDVGVGDPAPGDALGGGVGLLRTGVTAGIGEPASPDASGGQVDETGVGVVSDEGGAATERGFDAMAAVAGDTGIVEEGCGPPT
jgi:hypothetical protein